MLPQALSALGLNPLSIAAMAPLQALLAGGDIQGGKSVMPKPASPYSPFSTIGGEGGWKQTLSFALKQGQPIPPMTEQELAAVEREMGPGVAAQVRASYGKTVATGKPPTPSPEGGIQRPNPADFLKPGSLGTSVDDRLSALMARENPWQGDAWTKLVNMQRGAVNKEFANRGEQIRSDVHARGLGRGGGTPDSRLQSLNEMARQGALGSLAAQSQAKQHELAADWDSRQQQLLSAFSLARPGAESQEITNAMATMFGDPRTPEGAAKLQEFMKSQEGAQFWSQVLPSIVGAGARYAGTEAGQKAIGDAYGGLSSMIGNAKDWAGEMFQQQPAGPMPGGVPGGGGMAPLGATPLSTSGQGFGEIFDPYKGGGMMRAPSFPLPNLKF